MFSTFTDRFFHGMNKKNTKLIQTSNIKASLNSDRSRRSSQSRSKQTKLFDISSQSSMRNSLNKTLRTPSLNDGLRSVQDSFVPPVTLKQNQQYQRHHNVYSKTSSQFAPSMSIKQLQQMVSKQDKGQSENIQIGQKKAQIKLSSTLSIKDKLRQNIQRNAIKKYFDIQYLQNNGPHKQKVDEENIKKMLQLLNKKQPKQKMSQEAIKNVQILKNIKNKQSQSQSQSNKSFRQIYQQQIKEQNNKKQQIATKPHIQPLNIQKNKNQQSIQVNLQKNETNRNDKQKILPTNNEQLQNFKIQLPARGQKPQKQFKEEHNIVVDNKGPPQMPKTQKTNRQQNTKLSKNQQNDKKQKINKQKVQETLKQLKKVGQVKIPQASVIKQVKKQRKTSHQVQQIPTIQNTNKNNQKTNQLDPKLATKVTEKEETKEKKQINQNKEKKIKQAQKPPQAQIKTKNNKSSTKIVEQPIKRKTQPKEYYQIQDLQEIQLVVTKQVKKPNNQPQIKNQTKKIETEVPKSSQIIKKTNQQVPTTKKNMKNQQKKETIQQKKEQKLKPNTQTKKQQQKPKQSLKNIAPPENTQKSQPQVHAPEQKKQKNNKKQKFYDLNEKIQQIVTYLSYINEIGYFCKKSKKFYQKNKIQVFNQEYKTSCFYLWAQMCYHRQKFLRIITQKDEKLYGVEQWILSQPEMAQYLDQAAQNLQNQGQQYQKQLQTFHTSAKNNLPQQQKTLRKDNRIDFHLRCLTILQQQFKQIQKLYKKAVKSSDTNIQLYAQRLCIILQIFCLLKFLSRGQQIKQYIPIDQIPQMDMSTHYQNHKHLIVL